MTLKVRLAAMMVFLLMAVMALQYILSEREQRELVARLTEITSGINRSTLAMSEHALSFQHAGQVDSLRMELEREGLDGLVRMEHTTRKQVWVTEDLVESESVDVRVTLDHPPGEEQRQRIERMAREIMANVAPGDTTSAVVFLEVNHAEGDSARHDVAFWAENRHPIDLAVNIPFTVSGSGPYLLRMSYSLDQVTAELDAARKRSLVWLGALLAVGVLGASLVAFQFTRPILALQQSFRQVEAGDLDVRLLPRRNDEIGQLTTSFNQMVERLDQSRAVEARLARAERLATVGNLAAGVAHEVRNPLNAILLTLEQLRDKVAPADGPERKEVDLYLGPLGGEIQRLEHLVNAFLDLSAAKPLAYEPLDLSQALESAAQVFASEAASKGVKLSVDAPHPVRVTGDPSRLPMVWSNLLSNALGATPKGGAIRVRVAQDGDTARVTVGDTGPGIPADRLTSVWEPFVTGNPSGTGLGLSIVRSVVEAHGGTAEVESTPGSGAIFTVTLRVDPPASHPAGEPV